MRCCSTFSQGCTPSGDRPSQRGVILAHATSALPRVTSCRPGRSSCHGGIHHRVQHLWVLSTPAIPAAFSTASMTRFVPVAIGLSVTVSIRRPRPLVEERATKTCPRREAELLRHLPDIRFKDTNREELNYSIMTLTSLARVWILFLLSTGALLASEQWFARQKRECLRERHSFSVRHSMAKGDKESLSAVFKREVGETSGEYRRKTLSNST